MGANPAFQDWPVRFSCDRNSARANGTGVPIVTRDLSNQETGRFFERAGIVQETISS